MTQLDRIERLLERIADVLENQDKQVNIEVKEQDIFNEWDISRGIKRYYGGVQNFGTEPDDRNLTPDEDAALNSALRHSTMLVNNGKLEN